ncbi:MAG: hypothetical protein GX849_02480 [Clostridiaceae bacterium]|nr:hypothetical protein [Clostridiaceae bacterium]
MPEAALNDLVTILAAVFALVTLALMMAGLLKNRGLQAQGRALTQKGVALLKGDLPGHLLPADAIQELLAGSELEPLGQSLGQISHLHYQGRMLADPGPVLTSLHLYPVKAAKAKGGLYAILAFGLAALGALVTFVIYSYGQLHFWVLGTGLALLALGLISALVLIWQANQIAGDLEDERDRFSLALTSRMPVFMDMTGVAVLVSEMIDYGEKIREEVQAFSSLADQLASGDFAEGINRSVRDIMSQEVAPPLNEANRALTDLAQSLAQKQEEGMADLADRFSSQLAEALALHLAPLPDKLQILHQVAAHSADMMEESVITLTRIRKENADINEDVRESLRLMTLAKNDLADEMASVSDSMEILAGTTEKMSALYADEETDLASHIQKLTEQLHLYSDKIGEGITESANAIEASVRMSASHNKNAAILLERLDEQLGMLEEINRQIDDNTTHFTKESAAYVSRTLEEYDVSLAEVVERLTFTTAEIRDAIDVLPQVIRVAGSGRDV